ncbi:hypothetical protein ACVMFA_007405 [Bradyrhizobium liaoningense]
MSPTKRRPNQMTDDIFMTASPDDCKSDVLLLAVTQDEISVEIDDEGNVTLRQQDALGNPPDTIYIARRNLADFVSDLIDLALPECCSPSQERRLPASEIIEPEKLATPTSARRSPAADRQAKYRQRKRRDATAELSVNRDATASQPRPRV